MQHSLPLLPLVSSTSHRFLRLICVVIYLRVSLLVSVCGHTTPLSMSIWLLPVTRVCAFAILSDTATNSHQPVICVQMCLPFLSWECGYRLVPLTLRHCQAVPFPVSTSNM